MWHLCGVLRWMLGRGGYRIDESVVELAAVAKAVNLTLESRHLCPRQRDELVKLVA